MKIKSLILMAMMLSVTILLGYIPSIIIPFLQVPIIIQNLGIMLLGGILGWRKGIIVVIVFLLMAALGLPVLSGGRGGIGLFFTASGGYLMAYPISTALIGYILQKMASQLTFYKVLIVILLFGVIMINLLGILFIVYYLNAPLLKTLLASLIFLPGDIIKAVIATILIYRLKKVSLLRVK